MREILFSLFRGKRNHNEQWAYGNLVVDNTGEPHIVETEIVEMDGHHVSIRSDIPVFFIPETVGQYTGLTDKNGNKIFEGDILNCCLGESYIIGVVKYDQRIASFFVDYNNGKTSLFIDFFLANQNNEKVCFEVVGNIHDNPELLADL